MKYAEAVRLNAEGKLRHKVLTEQGWYVPTQRTVPAPKHDMGLPAVFRRKPGRPKKSEVI
jgi:hypothetical protein